MKHDEISDALNNLNDKIIEETNEVRQHPKGQLSFFQKYQPLLARLAASVVIVTVLGLATFGNPFNQSTDSADNSCGSTVLNGEDVDSQTTEGNSETSPISTASVYYEENTFATSQMYFSVEFFKASAKESANKNVLVSPLSMMQALAMTANGADGKTLTEMEQVLAQALDITTYNQQMHSYTANLPSSDTANLKLANSIWIRDDGNTVLKQDFLKNAVDYYDAQIGLEPFDFQTVNKINDWVSQRTDGMIEKIVEEIQPQTILYLINALSFDAQWENIYLDSNVSEKEFYTEDTSDEPRYVSMMHSEEQYYIEDETTTGFIKNYKNGDYQFVALLPKEGMTLSEYVTSLTSEKLINLMETMQNYPVETQLPKFSYDYELEMTSVLKQLGMDTAFDGTRADFTNMGTSSFGNIYIGSVFHKTFISVDEKGTEAGAVTSVTMDTECALEQSKQVYLNRPFVYMIVDGESKLPVFIGTVLEP